MSLWKIAWRSIQQRSLASALDGAFDGPGRVAGGGRAGRPQRRLPGVSSRRRGLRPGGRRRPRGAAWNWSSTPSTTWASRSTPCPMNTTRSCTTASPGSMAWNRPYPSAWATSYEDFPVVGTTPELFDRDRVSGRAEIPVCRGAEFQGREFHRGRHRRHRGAKRPA